MKTDKTTTKNNNEKSLIIANRVHISTSPMVIGIIITLLIFIPTIVFISSVDLNLFNDNFSIIILVTLSLLFVGLIITLVFQIKNAVKNNKLDPILITYKNNVFTIHNSTESLKINKKDIYDLDYKNHVNFIFTDHFAGVSTEGFGKFYIYHKMNNEEYELTLKNVDSPSLVYEKFKELLGWNLTNN